MAARARSSPTGEYATYDDAASVPRAARASSRSDEDAVEIRLGSLDDAPFELRPEAEVWIKRREPWLHEIEGASQHRENRH